MAKRKTTTRKVAKAVELTEPEAVELTEPEVEQEDETKTAPMTAVEANTARFKTISRDPITLSHLKPGDLFAIESTYYKVLSPQINGIRVARVRLEAGKLVDIDEYVMGYNTLVMSVVLE